MAELLDAFRNLAPYLTDPLVLGAFVFLLMFAAYRLLIHLRVISGVPRTDAASLIRSIFRYGFLIALSVIVLGFAYRGTIIWSERDAIKQARQEALALEQQTCQRLFAGGRSSQNLETVAGLVVDGIKDYSNSLVKAEDELRARFPQNKPNPPSWNGPEFLHKETLANNVRTFRSTTVAQQAGNASNLRYRVIALRESCNNARPQLVVSLISADSCRVSLNETIAELEGLASIAAAIHETVGRLESKRIYDWKNTWRNTKARDDATEDIVEYRGKEAEYERTQEVMNASIAEMIRTGNGVALRLDTLGRMCGL